MEPAGWTPPANRIAECSHWIPSIGVLPVYIRVLDRPHGRRYWVENISTLRKLAWLTAEAAKAGAHAELARRFGHTACSERCQAWTPIDRV